MIKYTSKEYIKIDIANQFGLDKLLFENRIHWVNKHKGGLLKLVEEAENKPRYLAAVYALNKANENMPIGHLVGLDMSASGIGIMSACMNDPVGAENVGIIGSKPKDIYTHATEVMNELLDLKMKLPRKDIKRALMTSFYGSVNRPKELFNNDPKKLTAFYETQEIIAPGAVKLKDILLDAWIPNALEHSWTMPDGFEVKIPVLQKVEKQIEVDELEHAKIKMIYEDNIGSERGLSILANSVHSLDALINREMIRRCFYDKNQLNQALYELAKEDYKEELSPHTFVSLGQIEDLLKFNTLTCMKYDLVALIKHTLAKPSFPVLSIHDEFMSHPNYMNYVRQTMIDIMSELSNSNILNVIVTEASKGKITNSIIPSQFISKLIEKSEYIIS